jgi:hypothetical protein
MNKTLKRRDFLKAAGFGAAAFAVRGCAGRREMDPNLGDIEQYKTILSGDLDGNDLQGLDPGDLLVHASRAKNRYDVISWLPVPP